MKKRNNIELYIHMIFVLLAIAAIIEINNIQGDQIFSALAIGALVGISGGKILFDYLLEI